jgi:hypothetical protein
MTGTQQPSEMPWHETRRALGDRLRDLGYDIVPPRTGDPPDGSIVARLDLGDRAIELVIDGGGRFRAALTWLVGEWPSRGEIAGIPVRVVDRVTRAVDVTGQVAAPEAFLDVVAGLDAFAPWASNGEAASASHDQPAARP